MTPTVEEIVPDETQTFDSSAWTGRGPNYTGHGLPTWLRSDYECARFYINLDVSVRTYLESMGDGNG